MRGVSTRPVRVRAVRERPPPPPGVVAPFPAPVDWWAGELLAWRWVDQGEGLWTGLVRYRREGLLHEHWVSGELLSTDLAADSP